MPPEGREKLEEWIRLLQPKVLRERLRLFVSTPPYEHEKDEMDTTNILLQKRQSNSPKNVLALLMNSSRT